MHKGHRVRLFVTLGAALTLVVSVALVRSRPPSPTRRRGTMGRSFWNPDKKRI